MVWRIQIYYLFVLFLMANLDYICLSRLTVSLNTFSLTVVAARITVQRQVVNLRVERYLVQLSMGRTTVISALLLHTFTHGRLTPHCVQATPLNTAINVLSTTLKVPSFVMPRKSAITNLPYFTLGGNVLQLLKKIERLFNLLKTSHDSANDMPFRIIFDIAG